MRAHGFSLETTSSTLGVQVFGFMLHGSRSGPRLFPSVASQHKLTGGTHIDRCVYITYTPITSNSEQEIDFEFFIFWAFKLSFCIAMAM